jgi:hypothetical protein
MEIVELERDLNFYRSENIYTSKTLLVFIHDL